MRSGLSAVLITGLFLATCSHCQARARHNGSSAAPARKQELIDRKRDTQTPADSMPVTQPAPEPVSHRIANAQGNEAATASDGIVEYFPPDSFLHGFMVSPPMISRTIPLAEFGRLAPMDPAAAEPFWGLAQWHCLESLKETDRILFGKTESAWQNPYQRLHIALDKGGKPVVSMTIDSLAIYNQKKITYERMARMRPHFLLYHPFYPDRDGVRRYGGAEDRQTLPDASTFPNLDTLDELTLAMSLEVAEATDLRHEYRHDSPENRRLHYNRNPFQFWFRVYCRDPQDSFYGRFFWLGYRAYDSEQPYSSRIPHERDQIESDGNLTFAYKLSDMSVHGENYADILADFRNGRETPIRIDVLAAARKAIRALQEQKQAFTDADESLAGYTISSFNAGWEPASPFRGTMVIRNLALRGRTRTAQPQAE